MKFDMPKAVFCGLALIAAAMYFGHGAKPTHAAFGSDVGRYKWHDGIVMDTKTGEVRLGKGETLFHPFKR